jgi:hypothetical protein
MDLEITPEERASRAARFRAAAAAPPPPPQRRFAHRDFDRSKMVISDAAERLSTLLTRKLAAGEPISEAQVAAAAAHGLDLDTLREQARGTALATLVPALYVEAGIVPKPKKRASSKPKAAPEACLLELRKSRRLSGVASSVAASAVATATAVAGELVASMPGGPTERSTLPQARSALGRISRLEASLAAGDTLTPGQLARIASRPLWEDVVARLETS